MSHLKLVPACQTADSLKFLRDMGLVTSTRGVIDGVSYCGGSTSGLSVALLRVLATGHRQIVVDVYPDASQEFTEKVLSAIATAVWKEL